MTVALLFCALGFGAALCLKDMWDPGVDPVADIVSIPNSTLYPADFDLQGDSSALGQAVAQVFRPDQFLPRIPHQIGDQYRPTEGRFFSWEGSDGVVIQLDNEKMPQDSEIYIVRLSEKSKPKFTTQTVTKKIKAQSGEVKKVYAWRDEAYAYAMVQSSGLSIK